MYWMKSRFQLIPASKTEISWAMGGIYSTLASYLIHTRFLAPMAASKTGLSTIPWWQRWWSVPRQTSSCCCLELVRKTTHVRRRFLISGISENQPATNGFNYIYHSKNIQYTSVGDPDPLVFGPPGSGSIIKRYGSGSFPFLIKVLSWLKYSSAYKKQF